MRARLRSVLIASFLALAAAVWADLASRPAVEIDLFADAPVSVSEPRLLAATVRGVGDAVLRLGPERSAGMLVSQPGEAAAGGVVGRELLRQVSVTLVAVDRVRIRVVSADLAGALLVAREVAVALDGAGIRERVRLERVARGGPAVPVTRLLAGLALLALAGGALVGMPWRGGRPRSPAFPDEGQRDGRCIQVISAPTGSTQTRPATT
jgi:hypothetical protein